MKNKKSHFVSTECLVGVEKTMNDYDRFPWMITIGFHEWLR